MNNYKSKQGKRQSLNGLKNFSLKITRIYDDSFQECNV